MLEVSSIPQLVHFPNTLAPKSFIVILFNPSIDHDIPRKTRQGKFAKLNEAFNP